MAFVGHAKDYEILKTDVGERVLSVAERTLDSPPGLGSYPGVKIGVPAAVELALSSQPFANLLLQNTAQPMGTAAEELGEAFAVWQMDSATKGYSSLLENAARSITIAVVKFLHTGHYANSRHCPKLLGAYMGKDDAANFQRHFGEVPLGPHWARNGCNGVARDGFDGRWTLVNIWKGVADGYFLAEYFRTHGFKDYLNDVFHSPITRTLRRLKRGSQHVFAHPPSLTTRVYEALRQVRGGTPSKTFLGRISSLGLKLQPEGSPVGSLPKYGVDRMWWGPLHCVLTLGKRLGGELLRFLAQRYGDTAVRKFIKRWRGYLHIYVWANSEAYGQYKMGSARAGRISAGFVDLWKHVLGDVGDIIPKTDPHGIDVQYCLNAVLRRFSETSVTLMTNDKQKFKETAKQYTVKSNTLKAMWAELFGGNSITPVHDYRVNVSPLCIKECLDAGTTMADVNEASMEEMHKLVADDTEMSGQWHKFAFTRMRT